MPVIREGLTFDDVLLVPQHSSLISRNGVDLTAQMGSKLFDHPVVPANMRSVVGFDLAREQVATGGLVLLHRFQPIGQILYDFQALRLPPLVGVSLGVKQEDVETFLQCFNAGVRIFCVDVAHGDSASAMKMVEYLKVRECFVIAGNVATREGAHRLFKAGVDAVKVGVGPGSLCTTRIETGCGVPQLTALMDIQELRLEYYPSRGIIADGGVKNAGDAVKALCFADMVMCGNLFAGCDESPDGLVYEGSSTHRTSHVEGVRAYVTPSGPYKQVLQRVLDGIRSGCSYQGCGGVVALQNDPQLIRITSAGLRESYPHDVEIMRT